MLQLLRKKRKEGSAGSRRRTYRLLDATPVFIEEWTVGGTTLVRMMCAPCSDADKYGLPQVLCAKAIPINHDMLFVAAACGTRLVSFTYCSL